MGYRLWPRDLEVSGASYQLVPRAVTYESAADGSVGGIEMSGGGCWMINFRGTGLYSPRQRRIFRALLAGLNGPVNPVVIPIWDEIENPIGYALELGPIPHSDGTYFSDLTGYLNSGLGGAIALTAALRATTLTVKPYYPDKLEAGMWLTVRHTDSWDTRLHIITGVAGSGATRILTIEPPLRSTLVAGMEFSLERPACTMRLAKGQAMAYEETGGDFPRPDVQFIEAFF